MGDSPLQPVVSDRATVYIQTLFSVGVFALGMYVTWWQHIGPAWTYTGASAILWVWIVLMMSVSVAGGIMWVMNLLYYRIQVYRHGHPHEQLEEQ